MCAWLGEEVRVTPKLQGSGVAGGEQLGDGVLGRAALIHGGGVGPREPAFGCKLRASWGRLWETERDLCGPALWGGGDRGHIWVCVAGTYNWE